MRTDSTSITLSRLLRTKYVERAVTGLTWLFAVLSIVALAYAVKEFVLTRMTTSEKLASLAAEFEKLEASKGRTHVPTKQEPPQELAAIAERNIFGPIGAPVVAPVPTPPKPTAKIPLNLIGTFVSRKEKPYAIIEDPRKGVQEVFDINDNVFGEAKLVGIFRDRVEIDREGTVEVLRMDEDAGAGADTPGGEDIWVAEAEVDTALGNLPLLLTQVRAVPYFKEGQPVGLRLFAIKAGSIFEKIGLRNGDILMSINGNSLADFSQAMKLFERLKSERSIRVSLERNREVKEIRYQIR
jgi:general secretion pathway protein C